MAKILKPDDKFIVNRSDVTNTVESSELLAEIQDTDWMVVNRGDQTYKISGEDVKDSLEPDVPEFVSKPTLLTPGNNSTGLSRDGLTMTCTGFSGTGDPVFASTTWQIAKDDAFAELIEDATTAEETSHDVTFSPPLEYEGIYYARCKHTSQEGTESDWSDVNEFEAEADPSLPTATMYGLRFDPNRETRLRSSRNVKDVKVCTISAWIKPTSNTSNFTIFDPTVNGTSTYFAYRPATDTVDLLEGSTVLHGVPASGILNKWTHVVLSSDGTDVKISVNGVTTTKTVSFTWRENGTFIPSGRPANSLSADGYMSDYYFVDGQALEPEVFGKSFEGKWGPLDSSDVYANIKAVESPQDSCPNYDQKWSDGTVNSTDGIKGGKPIENAFDGLLTTIAQNNGNSSSEDGNFVSIDLTSFNINVQNNVRVYHTATTGATPNSRKAKVNNTDFVENGSNDYSDIPFTGTLGVVYETLGSNVAANSSAAIAAIEVDGRLLIDGPADNSQVWSEELSFSPGVSGNRSVNGFDGNPDTHTSTNADLNSTITINNTFENVTSLRIQFRKTSASDTSAMEITGTGITPGQSFSGADTKVLQTIALNSTTVSNITITNPSAGNGATLAMVKVNDKILLDGCARWNTSQTWSDNAYEKASSDGIAPGDKIENLFNGADGGIRSFGYPAVDNKLTYFTLGFTQSLAFNTKAELLLFAATTLTDTTPNDYVSATGTNGTIFFGNEVLTTNTWVDISSVGSPLQDVTIKNLSGTRTIWFSAIRLDGEILVDGGSFGENGFHLPFNPDEGIGTDASGQGNHFTDENFTLTGSTQDTVKDTPMRNYAVLKDGKNGNLEKETTPEGYTAVAATQGITSGKYYWEVIPTDLAGSLEIGISNKSSFTNSESIGSGSGWAFLSSGNKIHNNVVISYGKALDVGDVVGLIYNADNYTLSFAINGDSQGKAYTAVDITSGKKYPAVSDSSNSDSSSYQINFGQQPFAASNVTYDQKAGTVMLDVTPSSDPTIDDSHYWSDYLTAKYNLINPTNGFDGNTATNVEDFFGGQNQDPPNGKHQLVFTPPQPLDGPVEIWTNLRPEVNYFGTWEVDTGSGFGSENAVVFPSDWVEVVPAGQQLHALRMQGNHQGASFAAIKANGKMLINPPYPGPYQTLYQNWEEWATFGILLYDENQHRSIAQSDVKKTYGTFYPLPEAGLQPLTEQPNYQVATYVQQSDGAYKPIESAEPSKAALASTQEQLSETQQELEATERQLKVEEVKFAAVMERNAEMRSALLKAGVEAPPVNLDIKFDRPGPGTMPIEPEPMPEPEPELDFKPSGTSAAIMPAVEDES